MHSRDRAVEGMAMKFSDLKFAAQLPPYTGGVRADVVFDNGYGAIVSRIPEAAGACGYGFPSPRGTLGNEYGLYELAVTLNGDFCDDSPIADGVLGWLSESSVETILLAIEAL